MNQRDRRLNRLATLLPRLAEKLGCRRKDHEQRERVEALPADFPNRGEVLARRKELARRHREQA